MGKPCFHEHAKGLKLAGYLANVACLQPHQRLKFEVKRRQQKRKRREKRNADTSSSERSRSPPRRGSLRMGGRVLPQTGGFTDKARVWGDPSCRFFFLSFGPPLRYVGVFFQRVLLVGLV